MTAVRMAQRPFPDFRGPAPWHVVVVDGPVFVAACDRTQLLDGEDVPLSATTPGFRCQRPACRNRWHEADET